MVNKNYLLPFIVGGIPYSAYIQVLTDQFTSGLQSYPFLVLNKITVFQQSRLQKHIILLRKSLLKLDFNNKFVATVQHNPTMVST